MPVLCPVSCPYRVPVLVTVLVSVVATEWVLKKWKKQENIKFSWGCFRVPFCVPFCVPYHARFVYRIMSRFVPRQKYHTQGAQNRCRSTRHSNGFRLCIVSDLFRWALPCNVPAACGQCRRFSLKRCSECGTAFANAYCLHSLKWQNTKRFLHGKNCKAFSISRIG